MTLGHIGALPLEELLALAPSLSVLGFAIKRGRWWPPRMGRDR